MHLVVFFLFFTSLTGATSCFVPKLMRKSCPEQTKIAFYSIFDHIMQTESKCNNDLEKLTFVANFIPKIDQHQLTDLLMGINIKFRVVFLVVYKLYWLKDWYCDEVKTHIGLYDLKQFLKDPHLISNEKLDQIMQYCYRASFWLAEYSYRASACYYIFSASAELAGDYDKYEELLSQIIFIKDSPNIRHFLERHHYLSG
jgi:hypothetical protein